MQNETTAEKELDAVINSIPARAGRTRTVAVMLTATPAIIAAILFTFSSGLAAHYERKFVAAEEELRAIKGAAPAPSPAISLPIDITPELRPLIEERDSLAGEFNKALSDAKRLQQEVARANQLIKTNLGRAQAAHESIIRAGDEHNDGTSRLYTFMVKYTDPTRRQDQLTVQSMQGFLSNMKGMLRQNEREHLQITDDGRGGASYSPGSIISSYRRNIITAIEDANTQQSAMAAKLIQFEQALLIMERKQRELATVNERIQALYDSHLNRR